jgi:hypothetical protein
VIQVDQTNEQDVSSEIVPYVLTDHMRYHYEPLLQTSPLWRSVHDWHGLRERWRFRSYLCIPAG